MSSSSVRRSPVSGLVALAALAAVALTGCTQRATTGSDSPVVTSPASSAAPASSPAGSSPAPPTDASAPASSSPAAPTTPVAPSTSAPPTTAPSSAPAPTPTIERGGCPTSALTIRALRGSGAAGHQFAFIQFTNASTVSCTLRGYPGIQLLLGGKPLGAPAQRSGKPVSTVTLAPGTSASAGINVDSACNASISDSVQVYPPNRTDRIVLKLALRGCPAQVDPVSGS